jgi:hypothetical protein
MFRSQFSDHHQESINRTCSITTYQRACFVVFQYVAVCCLYVCTYDIPVRVVSDYVRLLFYNNQKLPIVILLLL